MAGVAVGPAGQKAWRGVKAIRWDKATRGLIWQVTQELQAAGMERPPIRAVLYRLLAYPGWTKRHYDTLTVRLGEWRDAGLIPYGVYGDGSGSRDRPLTASEIAEQIQRWQEAEPAGLGPDGRLQALLVEHEALVPQIQAWCDGRAMVCSSAGQIRRENLWTAVQDWRAMARELGAAGIEVHALVDWDRPGRRDILGAHQRWFREVAGLELQAFGLSREQLERLGLDPAEDHQIDGVIGLDPAWWRAQVRALLLKEDR